MLEGPRAIAAVGAKLALRGVTELTTIVAEPWDDWGLIDCGNGQKLERYGPVTVARPEPQAMWAPARDDWDPDATFVPGSDEEGGGAGSSIGRFRNSGRWRAARCASTLR